MGKFYRLGLSNVVELRKDVKCWKMFMKGRITRYIELCKGSNIAITTKILQG